MFASVMSDNLKEIALLKSHGLKKTHARVAMLSQLMRSKHALTHTEIEKTLSQSIDRVTVYRILNDLETNGIIHKTFDHKGIAKYALCATGCTEHHHVDEHVHFHCISCNETICLDAMKVPDVRLPKGYSFQSVQMAVTGVCKNCQ